jgi:hypothetical protein
MPAAAQLLSVRASEIARRHKMGALTFFAPETLHGPGALRYSFARQRRGARIASGVDVPLHVLAMLLRFVGLKLSEKLGALAIELLRLGKDSTAIRAASPAAIRQRAPARSAFEVRHETWITAHQKRSH